MISIALRVAIFLTSPIPISISTSLEFVSLETIIKMIPFSFLIDNSYNLLSKPVKIAAALFSLAQMMNVKPNLSLYCSLCLLSLSFSCAVRLSSPASLCSLVDSGVSRLESASRPAKSGWPLRTPSWSWRQR